MKKITVIDITVFAAEEDINDYKPFTDLFLHLEDNSLRHIEEISPVDLNGLIELQRMILQGRTIYLTPEMATALGIEP
jgi:hypothetical protein